METIILENENACKHDGTIQWAGMQLLIPDYEILYEVLLCGRCGVQVDFVDAHAKEPRRNINRIFRYKDENESDTGGF